MAGKRSGWGIDLAVGGLCGLIAGAIVAVNLIIFTGVEGGYEAGVGDVFAHSILLGILVVAVLVTGPVSAVAYARLLRHRRDVSRAHVDIHRTPLPAPTAPSSRPRLSPIEGAEEGVYDPYESDRLDR